MRRDPESADLGPFEWVLVGLLASAVAVALLVNLVGAVAGLLFGDGWVLLGLADTPAILERLPDRLSDPRSAWPADVQAGLPGLAGFLAALVLFLATAAALVVLVLTRLSGPRRNRPKPARWAGARDLRSLRVRAAGSGRVILGRSGRRLLAAEPRQSVLVLAPTQTGKTTGLAVPAILEWDGPVLATSVKSDLVRDTIACRSSAGEVHVFDPAAVTGLPRAGWTPLAQCSDWEGARRTADRLARAAQSAPRGGQDAEFWGQAGARFLAPLLFAAALSGRGMGDVTRWIDAEEHEQVLKVLKEGAHDAARNAAIAVWGADDRLRSSLYMTASIALEAYNDPAVLESSRMAELTADWLLDGRSNTRIPVRARGRAGPPAPSLRDAGPRDGG